MILPKDGSRHLVNSRNIDITDLEKLSLTAGQDDTNGLKVTDNEDINVAGGPTANNKTSKLYRNGSVDVEDLYIPHEEPTTHHLTNICRDGSTDVEDLRLDNTTKLLKMGRSVSSEDLTLSVGDATNNNNGRNDSTDAEELATTANNDAAIHHQLTRMCRNGSTDIEDLNLTAADFDTDNDLQHDNLHQESPEKKQVMGNSKNMSHRYRGLRA